MTDRSSEERSRFEKWASNTWPVLSLAKDAVGEYHDYHTRYAHSIWRAALEDRQEAAPEAEPPIAKEVRESLCPRCDRQMTRITVGMVYRCLSCYPLPPKDWKPPIEDDMKPIQNGIGGVPSEATPSKENAPKGKSYFEKMRDAITPEMSNKIVREVEERFRPAPEVQAVNEVIFDTDSGDFICSRCESHVLAVVDGICEKCAAPEVQGTPTKSNVAHQPWCASAPRPMDAPMGRGPYQCDCGAVKVALPVGTPQKETPPKFTNRRGKPCSQACYEGRHAECTEDFVTCNCTFRGEHKTPHAYATVVPEGVQGKEPQTPEFTCEECDSHCCITAGGSKLVCYHCHLAKVERAIGEAAGRRSAITEFEKWAESQKSGLDEEATGKILDWCAELQEKP